MKTKEQRVDIDNPKNQRPSISSEPCERCAGTGLVCGITPVIDSKNCCVDYANALCPQCKGSGVKMVQVSDLNHPVSR